MTTTTATATVETPEVRVFAAVPVSKLPEGTPVLKPRSVGAAILRALGKRKMPLSEILDGFDHAYLSENRNLPKSEEYRTNKARYLDGYIAYLLRHGFIEKSDAK